MFTGIHFNEFVIKSEKDAFSINKNLLRKGIQGGLIIDKWYPELKNCMLFGISELHSNDDIEKLLLALKEVSNV
jgi:glycine dehydrogenase subunit 1